MRTRLLILSVVATLASTIQAGIIYSATSGTIPDGNPAGWSATATVSGYGPSITDVSVNLNISGGYNGDLYAYLSYGGVLVPLLNRVGVGTGNRALATRRAGMNITLADGYTDIHTVQFSNLGWHYTDPMAG